MAFKTSCAVAALMIDYILNVAVGISAGVGALVIHTPPQLHGGPLAQAVRRAGGTLFREVTYPTDHFFADYRLAVAGTVTEFLKGQLPQ